MKEYEIYLPMANNDGTQIDPAEIERVKRTLAAAFGGYTHLRQRSDGAWSIGGVTFRDEVTIVRVLDDGRGSFDLRAFKRELERALQQQSILIVTREVGVVR
jgi:hypothetical protein